MYTSVFIRHFQNHKFKVVMKIRYCTLCCIVVEIIVAHKLALYLKNLIILEELTRTGF